MNVKKLSIIVVSGTFMLTAAFTLAFKLSPDVEMEFAAGQEQYKVNGTVKAFDASAENLPFVDAASQKLMLPLRTVVEELGGGVTWKQAENAFVVVYEDKNLQMNTSSTQALLNGYAITLKELPVTVKESIYVPADFFKTYLGADVLWDAQNKQLTLMKKRAFQPVVVVNKKTVTLKEGRYDIEIPVVTGLNDGNFEKSLNNSLAENEINEASKFLAQAKVLYKDGERPYTFNTTCAVPYRRKEIISILISSSSTIDKSIPNKRAVNIDLQGQKILKLGDLFKDKNYELQLAKILDISASRFSNNMNIQFYINEKQQLVIYFLEDAQYKQYYVDWEEIEGILKPQYRFFTTANIER